MKADCMQCGYTFSYKEKLKYYLFPYQLIKCKCGKVYKISHTSLTTSCLLSYVPLLFYLYSLDTLEELTYNFIIIYLVWVIIVWLLTPLFITLTEVKNKEV